MKYEAGRLALATRTDAESLKGVLEAAGSEAETAGLETRRWIVAWRPFRSALAAESYTL